MRRSVRPGCFEDPRSDAQEDPRDSCASCVNISGLAHTGWILRSKGTSLAQRGHCDGFKAHWAAQPATQRPSMTRLQIHASSRRGPALRGRSAGRRTPEVVRRARTPRSGDRSVMTSEGITNDDNRGLRTCTSRMACSRNASLRASYRRTAEPRFACRQRFRRRRRRSRFAGESPRTPPRWPRRRDRTGPTLRATASVSIPYP